MTLRMNPYLVLNGNAREAIQFYAEALGAEIVGIQSFGEMPANPDFPLPEEAKDRVSHGLIRVGEAEIMFSDSFPGQTVQQGGNVTICILTDDPERSRTLFDALKQGGQVQMPLQETFWSPAYGTVTDKYGVTFQISTEAAR